MGSYINGRVNNPMVCYSYLLRVLVVLVTAHNMQLPGPVLGYNNNFVNYIM